MDLTQNVKVVISADAKPLETSTKQVEQIITKSQSRIANDSKRLGRVSGDNFGREFNTASSKWARVLGQTFGRYFGEWGRQIQEVLYMAKDLREVLPSRRHGAGGTGTIVGADIGSDAAQTVVANRNLQTQVGNINIAGTTVANQIAASRQMAEFNRRRREEMAKLVTEGFPDDESTGRIATDRIRMQMAKDDIEPTVKAAMRGGKAGGAAGAAGAVGGAAGAAGGAIGGLGLFATAGIAIGIAAVVTGLGYAIEKWMEYRQKVKDVSKELGITTDQTKEFFKEWNRAGDQDGMIGVMTRFVKLLGDARKGSVELRKQLDKDFKIDTGMSNIDAIKIFEGTMKGMKAGPEADKLALKYGLPLEQLDAMRQKTVTYGGSTGRAIYQPRQDYGDPTKRTLIATEANAIDESNEALKKYKDAKNRAAISGAEELPLLMIEVQNLRKKIAQEKDIIQQNVLKKDLIDKELELKKLSNDLTEKGIAAERDAKEAKMEADQKLLELQRDAIEKEADKIAKANPNLYNPEKQSSTDIVDLEAQRLANSLKSPSQLALERANDPTVWRPNTDVYDMAKEIGSQGSFKSQIRSAAQYRAANKVQTEVNRLEQILTDYIKNGGAFSIIPHNGK